MNAEEHIIDHYKQPRRYGRLVAPTVRQRDVNPFCGDELTVELQLEGGSIVDAAFEGRGCSLSLAAASILLDAIVGRSATTVVAMEQEDLLDLLDVQIGPVRQKCALLSLAVVHSCLAATSAPAERHDV